MRILPCASLMKRLAKVEFKGQDGGEMDAEILHLGVWKCGVGSCRANRVRSDMYKEMWWPPL